jgi:hypothetical protein
MRTRICKRIMSHNVPILILDMCTPPALEYVVARHRVPDNERQAYDVACRKKGQQQGGGKEGKGEMIARRLWRWRAATWNAANV